MNSWRFLRKILFLGDPELIHHCLLQGLHWIDRSMGDVVFRGMNQIQHPFHSLDAGARAMGMAFMNRVGLAAGFDKNAQILPILPYFGFGFSEIGTVTPKPQPGNEKPRLFRVVTESGDLSLFNRMGFNNEGAVVIAKRLAEARRRLPPLFRVGVNLGKNKDTPLEEAASDYALAVKPFKNLADYAVINVSSPNTPGLRTLQEAESLKKIVYGVLRETEKWKPTPPVLLKLTPEMQEDDLLQLIEKTQNIGVSGFVLTNTLQGVWEDGLGGGWSGVRLTDVSRQALMTARRKTATAIISVGGIMSIAEAHRRFELGADLIQVYSGWIAQGPGFPKKIVNSLKTHP